MKEKSNNERIDILKRRTSLDNYTYVGHITKCLNELVNPKTSVTDLYYNYLYDCRDIHGNAFAIRMPGSTYGMVQLDENNVIINIYIDDIYIKNKRYREDTNDVLRQFIGWKIEMPEK